MALGDGVRRFVRLVLDKSGVRKFQSESQRAIDRGTDPKKATKNLGVIDKGFGRLKKAALALGKVLAAAFAVRAIVRFGKEAVRVAAEAEAIWNRLRQTVENTGVAYEAVEGRIVAVARTIQDATTIGDEAFATVLQELISTSDDFEASLENVQVALDLAAAKQIDLKTAAQLVGRAMVGQTATLTRYGIVIQEGADAIETLRERFRGMAENEAKTLEGRIAQLNNEWDDLRQAIGDVLIEAGGGTSVIETLTGTLKALTASINENRVAISKWLNVTVTVFRALAAGLNLERIRLNIAQMLTRLFSGVSFLIGGVTAEIVNMVGAAVNVLLDGLDKIPGVSIDFRFNEIPTEQFFDRARESFQGMRGDMGDIADAARNIASAWRDVFRAATAADKAQEDASSPPPPAPGGTGGGGGQAPIPSPSGRTVDPRQRIGGSAPSPVTPLLGDPFAGAEDRMNQRVQQILEQTRTIQGASQSAAFQVQLAWEEAFGAMFSGFTSVQEAAVELAKGMAGALIGGLADYASSKVAENIALAFEEHAKGTAALANPFLAGTAPGHFAAAKAHAITAAKWAALSGLAGAAGAAVSGGGRSGGAVGGGGTNRLVPGFEGDRQGTEVHIFLDPFDPDSPLHQRQVGRAAALARERFGDQVPVKLHRGARSREEP